MQFLTYMLDCITLKKFNEKLLNCLNMQYLGIQSPQLVPTSLFSVEILKELSDKYSTA